MPLMLISTLATAADLCETGKWYFADLGCKGGTPAWHLTVPYPRLPIWLQACLSACLLVYKSMIVTHVNLKHIVTTWIQHQRRTCVLGASSGLQCLQILRYTSMFNNPPKLESGREDAWLPRASISTVLSTILQCCAQLIQCPCKIQGNPW